MVKTVDILRNNSHLPSLRLEPGFELCNGSVTCVRCFSPHHLAAVVIELPYQRRVGFERLGRGQLLGSVRAPQTSRAPVHAQ